MITPVATYRLQLRNGMTFARAAELAPYLAALGISHLYVSPIFEAVQGSTHGYDAIDNSAIATKLGGEPGFRAMTASLRQHSIGVIVDFVPNHMGATPDNPWWRDVLEWGAAAKYSQHFDIDWSAAKLIVPALAQGYGTVLERGELGLAFDARHARISLTYGGLELPLTPTSYAQVLCRVGEDAFSALAHRFAVATPETASELKAEFAAMVEDAPAAAAIVRALGEIETDLPTLHALHELQVWRLTHWRAAREALTYRRFFEITDLVGLKVERPSVFEDVHAHVIALVRDGSVDGLRLDHIDGLADPGAYLEQLQASLTVDEPAYLLVEKILGSGEALRKNWPVAGTTGYEFIRALAGLLVAPSGEAGMTRAYHGFIGEIIDYSELARETKRRTLTRNLAGELEILKDMARALAARDLVTRDLGADTLRRAIIELAAALAVYRTYVGILGPHEMDRSILMTAAHEAKATREVEDEQAIDFLARMASIDFAGREDQVAAFEFALRFQQTTGPLMAKAVEDTVFYRYNRLVALNEVGGEPSAFGVAVEDFHRTMAERCGRHRGGLSATATHDTKRGEDARARLYVLSEMPDAWAEAVSRWKEQNAALKLDIDGVSFPDPETEWWFYQSLAGAWPLDLKLDDAHALETFAERMVQFALKAAREAKTLTSWTGPDAGYEWAVERFVRAALDTTTAKAFLVDFVDTCRPIIVAGALNGLTQTLIKIAAPGVPDIYQGCELWDFSMVDPDNRRPVDFQQRASLSERLDQRGLDVLIDDWRSGAIKLRLVKAGLQLRQHRRALFDAGDYLPLEITGAQRDHVVAFARVLDADAALVIAPRLVLSLLDGIEVPMVPSPRWGDTAVILPPHLAARCWKDACSGEDVQAKTQVALGNVLRICPVALMASTDSGNG